MYLNYRLPVHSCLLAAEAVKRRDWFVERAMERARANLPILSAWLEGETRVACRLPDGGLMASLRLPNGTDDLEFGERLLAKGVAVGPGRYWGAPGSIRVTFSCSGKELSDGLEVISQILGQ
jgi:DNA-binding transcriptional MocR family regulator